MFNHFKLLFPGHLKFFQQVKILTIPQPLDILGKLTVKMLWFDKESIFAISINGYKLKAIPLKECLPTNDGCSKIQIAFVSLHVIEIFPIFYGQRTSWSECGVILDCPYFRQETNFQQSFCNIVVVAVNIQ